MRDSSESFSPIQYSDRTPTQEKDSFCLEEEETPEQQYQPFQRAQPAVKSRKSICTLLACVSISFSIFILIILGQRHGAELVKPLTSTYLTRLASSALPHVTTQTPPAGLSLSNFTQVDPSKILLLQVDDRDISESLALGQAATQVGEIPFYANSVLANVLYAQRYGYKYKRMQAVVPKDVEYRHITWW